MEEWVQATQEAYKGFIERPPMEQKHLSRPPFMFIIQIFFEVMTKTGFGKGLYEPVEFTKDYFTDPQKKVFVLKKLIHLVRMVEGKFEILPENIVRGTDCDKTNVFLQKLAKAAKSGTNTDELVSKILDKASKGSAGGAGDTQELASAAGSKLQAPEAKTQHMLSGHQRDVADLTKEAKIAANEPEAGEAGGIRMGSLNRAGKRQDSRVLAGPSASIGEKAPAEAADQAVTSIATLKEAIQNITQSINPMGKIIQFMDDDVESMKREFDSWARIYANAKEQLEDKEKAIEAELQPYKDKIVAKEEQIREKKGQIDSLKSKILRNNLKIKKLLSDIVGAN